MTVALLWRILGGRPMIRDESCSAFIDKVSGWPVYRFTDRLGRKWLAGGPWDLFRVAR